MYICPTCGAAFAAETAITKHFLSCWKEKHPNHRSKDAPRSENIITREDNEDILNFFNSFN